MLESSHLSKIIVYVSYLYMLRTKRMLQSIAEKDHQCQEKGTLRLQEAMKALELGWRME